MSRIGPHPRILILFLIICSISITALGQNDEWPCWRGPNRDGKSADTGLLKEWPDGGPELLWKVSDIGKGFSTVAVTGGFIYTTGDVDRKLMLFAFGMDGTPKWNERAVGKGSVCFADGMLYLFGESGGRAALATCSPEGLTIKGNVTVEGTGPSSAHPVVIGGRLYLRYADNLYCFDVKAK